MNMNYFVELINVQGEVQTRYSFAFLPIRIGRGYGNDLILDDPYIAAEHAILDTDEQGQLCIRDLGSINGIHINGKKNQQQIISGHEILQLGQTQLRVRTSHFVVPAELVHTHQRPVHGWLLFLAAVVVVSVLSLSNTWLGDISASTASAYAMSVATWLGFSAAWAGIWALANRVFGGGAHFSRHLFTLSLGLAALDTLDYLCMFLGFGFSWEFFTRYSSHLQIAFVATLIYFHLRQITPRNHLRLKLICIAFSVIGSGLMLMKNVQATNQYSDELYMHEILPPVVRISRDHSVAEFDKAMQDLKSDIDAEREKTLKEKAKKNKKS